MYLVALCLLLAPFQQSVPLRTTILPGKGCQWVLSLHTNPGGVREKKTNMFEMSFFFFPSV